MISESNKEALKLVIDAISSIIDKKRKKAVKEREKCNNAFITYKGEKYYTFRDLEDAYACDVFNSNTYDRLQTKLEEKRNLIDGGFTPTEQLITELNMIKNNFLSEILEDEIERKAHDEKEKRIQDLIEQGYSYQESMTILGNEELMRFE